MAKLYIKCDGILELFKNFSWKKDWKLLETFANSERFSFALSCTKTHLISTGSSNWIWIRIEIFNSVYWVLFIRHEKGHHFVSLLPRNSSHVAYAWPIWPVAPLKYSSIILASVDWITRAWKLFMDNGISVSQLCQQLVELRKLEGASVPVHHHSGILWAVFWEVEVSIQKIVAISALCIAGHILQYWSRWRLRACLFVQNKRAGLDFISNWNAYHVFGWNLCSRN